MPKDKNDVQAEEARTETESTEAETQTTETAEGTEEKTEPQFLTKEEVQQMLTEERERIKQSSRDISRGEIEKARGGQRFAEDTLAGLNTGLGQLDPEQAQSIRAQAELAAYRRKEAEGAQRQQMDVFDKSFTSNMTQFITSAGLDPNDKRIDWAEDVSGDYLAKQQRILASIAQAQKEDASTAEGKRSQEVRDMEDRLRKEFGHDSVDTSASGGAVETGGFAKIEQDYAEGKITYADYKKARKKYNIGG